MKRHAAYAIIAVTAVVTHGLLLFNDGHYVDGWPTYTQLAERNWDLLFTHLYRAGLPGTVLFYSVMDYFPGLVFKFRIVAFLAIVLMAMLVYRIAEESKVLSRWESVSIALISLTYPAFQASVIMPVGLYLAFYCLFILAAYLALRSERMRGAVRYAVRGGSLVLFVVSFNINSLLVFYFGFLFLLFLLTHGQRLTQGTFTRAVLQFVPRRLDFLLLPFAFWVVKEALFPRYGEYAAYNRFRFSPTTLVWTAGRFFGDSIYGQLNDALRIMLQQPALALLLVGTMYGASRAFTTPPGPPAERGLRPHVLLAFGVVLFALGIFPYVVVGSGPALHGFATRNALLVGLPMAVILTATIRLMFSRGERGLSKSAFAVVATLVVAFSLTLVDNYFAWQGRWAKDRSIMVKLSHMTDVKRISVFWIDDQFQLPGALDYAAYDWSSMFKQVWGGESRVGLSQMFTPEDWTALITTWALYNLSELDQAGCQAVLTIKRGPAASPDAWKLALHYLFLRFLKPEEMTRFLEGLTRIRVDSISAPEARNCPAAPARHDGKLADLIPPPAVPRSSP
jgi:hypothetical protein